MSKVVRFPVRRVKRTAAYLLRLSTSPAPLKRQAVFVDQPPRPEALGNMLQHLLSKRPHAILVFENVVAEMLAQID